MIHDAAAADAGASSRAILRALRGERTRRRPLWIMRQAGRYLPEYRELRATRSFEQLCASPDLATEVTLMPLRRFPLDAAIVFADIMSPVASLGIEVFFAPGPVVDEPLRDRAGVDALPEPSPDEIAPEVIETIRNVRGALADEVALLGFAAGPWTLAAYLVEGGGKRGFPALRTMAYADPETLAALLARLARVCGDYLVEQARAGADAVQVFETWSGILSAPAWARWVKPHLCALLDRVAAAGVPRILFMQDSPHLVEAAADLPVDAFSFDWRVDLATVRDALPSGRAIQGNLDPGSLLAGPEATRAAAEELLSRVAPRGHIVNLGHGILPSTPIASVEALVAVVHDEGQRR